MPQTLVTRPATPADGSRPTALHALNAIKRAPRMAILRSIRAGNWHTGKEIEDLIGFSAHEALPHLAVLQDLGILLHDQGHFSLNTEALNSLLLQSLEGPA
jgi:predicted transcriptional regulator